MVAVLLQISCGGGGGQTGAAGNSGGGGSGASGQAGNTGAGGASCVSVPACGGNIVGTWRVTQSCVTATKDLSSTCPGATTEITFVVAGTITYNADGTYVSTPVANPATVHEYFPAGCMPFGLSCDQLGQSSFDAGGMTSGACSMDATGACICDGTIPTTATGDSGTYSTSGGTLTLMKDGGTSSSSYCVQGNLLYEMAGASDGGAIGLGDGGLIEMGGVVFTKQ
jgi:hypothetical protein